MTLVAMASRNLVRRPRRTMIAVLTGAGGLFAAVLIVNLARGIYDQGIRDAVRLGPGHLTVHRAGRLFLLDVDSTFADQGLSSRIAALPGVEAVLPRLYLPAVVHGPRASRAALVVGIDVPREAGISPLARRIAQGTFPGSGGSSEALATAALAVALGAGPADEVRIARPGASAERVTGARLSGVLDPGLDSLDGAALFVPLPLAQAAANADGYVHELAVQLLPGALGRQRYVAGEVRRLLEGRVGLTASPWTETLPELRDAIALDRIGHRVLFSTLLLMVGIGVLAVLLAAVLERTRELGLMLALGTPPPFLRRLVVTESALLGLLSVASGLAGGAAATFVLARHGLDLRFLAGDEVAYGGTLFSLRIFAAWDVPEVALAAAALFAAHLLAGLYPAWRAASLRPGEAMRSR